MPESKLAHTKISPANRWIGTGLREAWGARELVWFLTWRNVKVRYAQATMGAMWALLQPALMVIIFTLILGRVVRVQTPVPYPVFVLTGIVPWTICANAVSEAAESLVQNSTLVTKVYFPRLALPISAILCWLPDAFLSSVAVIGLGAVYDIVPRVNLMVVVPAIGLGAVAAASLGFWLAALNVRYRDVRHAVPFLLQVWFFSTPIVYPLGLVPAHLQRLFALNPMLAPVELFRYGVIGASEVPASYLMASCLVSAALVCLGLVYFQRVQQGFADVI